MTYALHCNGATSRARGIFPPMNTDPFHQLKAALQTAGALTDQSLKEIERLSIQNEELRADRDKFKNALYGHVEYPSIGEAWEKAAQYQLERDQLKQQLAQAQVASLRHGEVTWLREENDRLSDEAKRLEADAAAMREFIEKSECGRKCCDGHFYMEFSSDGTSTSTERIRCEICESKRQLLSTTAGRSLLERLERYRVAMQELTDAIYGDYRRMKLYMSKGSSLTGGEQRIVTAYDNAREALKDTP